MSPPDATSDPLVQRALERIGMVLREKWRLDGLLGVGGMAAVYAATHRNGRRVAVKVLHAELATHQDVRNRFLREGYAANKVNHPGAVAVLDDDIADDGSVFLVMELLDGESLQARCERLGGRLEPGEVLSIGDQLLDVLTAAHAEGVIHRDLKPENIFATRDGRVKVLDFGIARVRELSGAGSPTRTGMTMGTPAFMAPEAAHGRWDLVDARTDLWAVGATLFTLLTGRLVHPAGTINEMLVAAMTRPAPSVSIEMPYLHPAVAMVIDRALAFDKTDRWPDALAMQEAIRAAYHAAFRCPITTAPSLTVPPADADSMYDATSIWGGGRTSGAMVAGRTGVAPAQGSDRRRRWMLAGGAAMALAALAAITGALAAGSNQVGGHVAPSIASRAESDSDTQRVSASAAAVSALAGPSDRTDASVAPGDSVAPSSNSVAPLPPRPSRPPKGVATPRPPATNPAIDPLDIRR